MSRFRLRNLEHSRAGEGERALMARMMIHDARHGVGGYYVTSGDLDRFRRLFGRRDADAALAGAGFFVDPENPRRWRSVRRTATADPLLRFVMPWDLLQAIAHSYGDTPRPLAA